MSNFLTPIDLTDRAIRRAVFAVFDGPATEHRTNRKESERLRTDAQGERAPMWERNGAARPGD